MITYRRATAQDNLTTLSICIQALEDYSQRHNVQAITGANDPQSRIKLLETRRSFWDHLSQTSDNYWIAERDGEAIGYARSILRGKHRELTEFFVLPSEQSAGVGKELLSRAFPNDVPYRSIVATTDQRALSRYLKSGVYPYLTELYFERAPGFVVIDSNLQIERMDEDPRHLKKLAKVDSAVLGYRRDEDHLFLMHERQLYLYKYRGWLVGYGYIHSEFYGPFALLDNSLFPPVLAHAENMARKMNAPLVGFEVPSTNAPAIDYLIRHKYRLEGFMGSIMSNKPFGKLSNYILTSPPYIL